MTRAEIIPLAATAVVCLIAAGTDLWKFKVYNALTIPALFSGIIVSCWLGGIDGLTSSLLGAAIGFGLLVVFFAMGGVGAGDVKLLTALGAWIGPNLIYQVFIASAIAGGIYAVALLILQSGLIGTFSRVIMIGQKIAITGPNLRAEESVQSEVRRPDRRRRLVPYAAMICLGFFATTALWAPQMREVWPPYYVGGDR